MGWNAPARPTFGDLLDSGKHAAHHSTAPEVANECTGIQVGNDGDACDRNVCASSSERQLLVTPENCFLSLDPTACWLRYRRNWSMVADLRAGENNNLPGIRGIGEDLLISGNCGIEDYFARTFGGRTKTPALEDSSVFQSEDCRVRHFPARTTDLRVVR